METKKLTCCDLMVGDYVYSTFSDKPCKVQAIELSKHGYGSVRVMGVDGVKDINSVSPISLTTEVLEKNGFTRLGTNYILEGEHFGLDNPSNPNNYLDNYWLRISINAVKIEYVHELQRVLRFLKINKDIAL